MFKTLVICFVFLSYYTYAVPHTIKGYLFGYDGKPMPQAHIHYNWESEMQTVEVNKDGSFSFEITDAIFVGCIFTGVGHFAEYKNIILTDEIEPIELDICLSPFFISKEFENIKVIGNFNNFSTSENFITLAKIDDTTFSGNIEFDEDTLLYQIIYYTSKESSSAINGQNADFHILKNRNDYISGLISKAHNFNILINLDNYSPVAINEQISSNNPDYAYYIKMEDELHSIYNSMLAKRSHIVMNPSEYEDSKIALKNNKEFHLDSMEKLLHTIESKALRNYGLYNYMRIACDGQNISNAMDCIDEELLLELKEIMQPGMLAVDKSRMSSFPLYITLALEDDYTESEYLSEILEKHNTNATSWLLNSIIKHADNTNDTFNIYKYYEMLLERFPDSKAAESNKKKYVQNKNITIGKIIPEFSLPNMENKNEIITPMMFQGKYVLVYIWSTSCSGCLLQSEYLEEAFEKFKKRDFMIYSISFDDDIHIVNSYRNKKHSMSWLHSLSNGGWESDIAKNFEVSSIPKLFLIDKNGIIIETENLRGVQLIKTLSKYLD